MSSHLDRSRLWRIGALAAGAAAIINLVIFGLGRAAGVPFIVPLQPGAAPTSLNVLSIILNSVGAFALGLLVTTFIAARDTRRLRAMQIVAAVVTVVSLYQPIAVDADTASRVLLAVMHPIVGTAFILALRRVGHPSPTTPARPLDPASDAR